MRTITALVDHHLTWIQKKGLRPEYELRFGDELVATLSFPRMLSSRAILETGDGSWAIERQGFFNSKIVVRPVDSESNLAVLKENVWKGIGMLELSEGGTMEIRMNMWKDTFRLFTAAGEQMVETTGRGFFRFSADVTMAHKASQLPELPWLVPTVFYLMLMKRRESAAHSAAH